MANVWDEFDKAYDLDGLNKDLKDNENNSGNYREVPHGTYEVAVNKMELAKSKKGKPMVSIWFKIAAWRVRRFTDFLQSGYRQQLWHPLQQ